MPNIQDINFNKNVSMVYVEEQGFTGYKGLDFTKLDNVEDILRQGVRISGFDVNLTTTNSILSGIKSDTDSVDGKLFITGDPFPAGVQGTIVFQADLTSQFDNVDISGQAGSNINTIKNLLSNQFNLEQKNIDAFGRLRISEPYTLADYSHIYAQNGEFLTKTNGINSKVNLNSQQAKARLQVDSGANDFTIHQSRMYHNYLPGKSQLAFQSFNFHGSSSGTYKRVGLFDDYNGIFFQLSGDGTPQIVLRSNVSGYIYDNIVPQINWNIDKCDGNGTSKFNINLNKTQLFYTDYQWLGVGRVRAGFVHDGLTIIAHEFYHSNNLENVYWKNPNLPIRCELRNYNLTTGLVITDQICSTVMSEGGYKEAGYDFAATGIRTISAETDLGIFGLRLKTGYNGELNRTIVRLGQVNILSTKIASFEIWRLPQTGSIIGGQWISPEHDSAVEYNTNMTSYILTSGDLFDAGFISAGGGGVGNSSSVATNISETSMSKKSYIAQNIDSNNSNVFFIKMKNFDTSQASSMYYGVQWREIR